MDVLYRAGYSVKSLASILDGEMSGVEALEQIDSVFQSFPNVEHPGNDFGSEEEWAVLMTRYPQYVHCLLDRNSRIVGYWSLFPLAKEIVAKGLAGENINRLVTTYDVDEFSIPGDYVGYFVDFYLLKEHHGNFAALPKLHQSIARFLRYSARAGYFFSSIFAHTASHYSINLAERLGFTQVCDHQTHVRATRDGCIVPTRIYSINLTTADANLLKMDKALPQLYTAHYVSSTADDTSAFEEIKDLDAQVEHVETFLRKLIAQRLNDNPSLLPDHVRVKVYDRVHSDIKRFPDTDADSLVNLSGLLDYADLTELLATMTAKGTDKVFTDVFPTKELLISKFGQLASLRNGLRHKRPISTIAKLEGKAAIQWFKAVLPK